VAMVGGAIKEKREGGGAVDVRVCRNLRTLFMLS